MATVITKAQHNELIRYATALRTSRDHALQWGNDPRYRSELDKTDAGLTAIIRTCQILGITLKGGN